MFSRRKWTLIPVTLVARTWGMLGLFTAEVGQALFLLGPCHWETCV